MNSLGVFNCLVAMLCCLVVVIKAGTNCQVGNCACNSQSINVRKPGQPPLNLDVCCPPATGDRCSTYFRAGSANATSSAFCTCDYIRITGTCLKGDSCNGVLGFGASSLGGMKICCPTLSQKISFREIPGSSPRSYECSCSAPPTGAGWTGSCWKGSQCDSCDPGYVGSANGLKLCCANCVKKGLIINAGAKSCDCNN